MSSDVKGKRKRKNLMEENTISTEERRKLRQSERELSAFLKDHANELAVPDSSSFLEATQRLENLYSDVCYPREANLDAINLVEISDAIGKQAGQLLQNDLIKCDPMVFVQKLRHRVMKNSTNGFDWLKLGKAVYPFFKSVPQIDFISGTLGKEQEVTQKERKRKPRKTVDNSHVEETQPTDFSRNEYRKDRKDAQACRLKKLVDTINDKTARKKKSSPLFNFVINPKSFSETVENFFDLSFLIRDGTVAASVDKNGLPQLTSNVDLDYDISPPAKQSVIEFTPALWKSVVEGLDIQEPHIGARS